MNESEGVKTMKKKSRIPEFKSLDEEARWWETHPVADYMDEFKIVKAEFAKDLYEKSPSKGVTVRLDTETIDKLETQAKKKGLGTTTLIRMWLLEHMEEQEQEKKQKQEDQNQYHTSP
jgi:predicted DNA binding CopG/RHH family protein